MKMSIKETICIYPGRFQPMGLHHVNIFKSLQEKYGEENVYVTTTNEVQLPNSPLNINEKKLIMSMHDIPRKNIVEAENLFSFKEVLNGRNLEETAIVFAAGKKTLKENKKWIKENNTKFKKIAEGKKHKLKPVSETAYIFEIKQSKTKIQETGLVINGGTDIREALASGDEKAFRSIMGFHNNMIRELLAKKFAGAKSFNRKESEKLEENKISNIVNEFVQVQNNKYLLLSEQQMTYFKNKEEGK